MLPTGVLSMWISNTATTAMMLPISEAVLQSLQETHRKQVSKRCDVETETKNDKGKNAITGFPTIVIQESVEIKVPITSLYFQRQRSTWILQLRLTERLRRTVMSMNVICLL